LKTIGKVARITAAVLAIVVGAAVFATLAAVVYVRTERGHETLRRLVVAQARESIPGLEVGGIGGGLFRDVSLHDVTIRDASGAPAVQLRAATARYRLWSLLKRRVQLDAVVVDGLRVVARPDPRGGLNLSRLVRSDAKAKPAPATDATSPGWDVEVRDVKVHDVSGSLTSAAGEVTALKDLAFEGAFRLRAAGDLAASIDALRAVVESGGRTITAKLSAHLRGPRENLRAHAELDVGAGGRVAVDGSFGLRDGADALGPFTVDLTATELDPSALVEAGPPGRVSFTVSAEGEGTPLAPASTAAARLTVAPSTIADARILGGEARATIHGERWELERLQLKVAGRKDLRGSAEATLRASGLVGGPLTATGHVQVRSLAVAGARVRNADLGLDVTGTPAAPTGTVTLVASGIVASPDAPRIDRLNLRLSGDRGNVKVQASARGPRLRAAVAAHGMATSEGGDVTVTQLALDMTTRTFRQQLTLVGSTRARYDADGDVTLARTTLQGAGARFTGRATFEGEYHPRRQQLARLALRLDKASTGGLPAVNATLRAALTKTRATATLAADVPTVGARVDLDADLPVVIPRKGPPKLAARGPVQVRLAAQKVALQKIPIVQKALARQGVIGGVATLNLTATGDIARPDARAAFELRDVTYRNIAGLGRDSTIKTVPGLGGTLGVEAKAGSITSDVRLLIRNTGVLDVHALLPVELGALIAGRIPSPMPFRANVEIPTLRLASLADFTDELKGVDGKLHGRIEVSGDVDHPRGRADIAIDEARVDKVRFARVQLHGEADGNTARARLDVDQTAGGRLTGSFVLDRAHADRLEAYLTGKDLDVGFARVFLTNVREIAGIAQLSVTAKGTLAAPRLWGSLSLDKGRLGVTGQPTFTEVRLASALEPGKLSVNDLRMTSGEGTLQGNGWVTLGGPSGLEPKEAVLRAHARRFLVAIAGSSGARIDGNLAVQAALRSDVLSGTAKVPNASVWLSKTPSATGGNDLQKIGSHPDVRFVDPTAQAAAERALEKQREAASEAIRVAFKASASPVYVRGKDVDLEVRSKVTIGTQPDGPHKGAVTLGGAIHIPRGRLNVQGQRFDFDHGDITFDGSWDVNPALDIKLTRQYPEALVVIELRGTPRKPQLRLTSDPPVYDQSQIVSLVLTGQPGGQPSNGKSFDATSAVATAVLSKLADRVAPELGLDVLRVEKQDVKTPSGQATGDTDTRVEVGKYVTERIYLSYAHIFGAPVNANQNEAHVEYRMTRRWMLETIFGDAGQGGVDALWTYRV
jgi:autotransporter translocation and assembly factor TamB